MFIVHLLSIYMLQPRSGMCISIRSIALRQKAQRSRDRERMFISVSWCGIVAQHVKCYFSHFDLSSPFRSPWNIHTHTHNSSSNGLLMVKIICRSKQIKTRQRRIKVTISLKTQPSFTLAAPLEFNVTRFRQCHHISRINEIIAFRWRKKSRSS